MPAAITSAGIITGHGLGKRAFLSALLEGKSAIRQVMRFPTGGLCSNLAAEVLDSLGDEAGSSRACQLLLSAANEALHNRPSETGVRRGVVIGTTKGGFELRERPGDVLGEPAQVLAKHLEATGPVRTISAACASSTAAIGEGLRLIESSNCDEIWVGGTEALHSFVYSGFHALKALSTRPAAPFDRKRTGLSLGEGAGILVLEPLSLAREKGRKILAIVEGYGGACDAQNQVSPDPSVRGLISACRLALRDAAVGPESIDRYHAHGTGTLQNDRAEALLCHELFGKRIPVCAVKGCVGHTLGAAGAIDAIAAVLLLSLGMVAPIANLEELDPRMEIEVAERAGTSSAQRVLLGTAGFGGINAALVIARGADR